MRTTRFGSGGPWAELVSLPRDSLGFVRRECHGCHRLFKVRGTALEGKLVFERLSAQVRHANADEAAWPEALRHCPYCGVTGTDDQWFTAEQRAWLDKRGQCLGQEVRYEQLSYVERTLADNPNPTFLAVRPEAPQAGGLGREPDDMRVLPLFCCREEIKISENWPGPVSCFFCGTEHELGSALVRDRLSHIFG